MFIRTRIKLEAFQVLTRYRTNACPSLGGRITGIEEASDRTEGRMGAKTTESRCRHLSQRRPEPILLVQFKLNGFQRDIFDRVLTLNHVHITSSRFMRGGRRARTAYALTDDICCADVKQFEG